MNPDIKATVETQPAGTEGDNLMKTKLATGEMNDVFGYNSGSLFQALSADKNLVPLTDEAWVAALPDRVQERGEHAPRACTARRSAPPWPAASSTTRRSTTTSGSRSRPPGTSSRPTTTRSRPTARSMPSSRPTARPGPRSCSCSATSPTSSAQDPEWAEQYTANERKYVDQPALQASRTSRRCSTRATSTRTSRSATYDDGLSAWSTGTAAHYPMLTQRDPGDQPELQGQRRRRGLLRPAGAGRCDHGMTIWLPERASTSRRPPRAPSWRRPRSSSRSSPRPRAARSRPGSTP